jgi:hypothetical protein
MRDDRQELTLDELSRETATELPDRRQMALAIATTGRGLINVAAAIGVDANVCGVNVLSDGNAPVTCSN